MSQNDQQNNNEQNESSKLPKPSNLNNYFNKIEDLNKLFQIDVKLKPNSFDKNTKFTIKGSTNTPYVQDLVRNAKLKFQTKQGKTKLSINTKLIEQGNQRQAYRKFKPEFMNQHLEDIKFLQELEKKYGIREGQQKIQDLLKAQAKKSKQNKNNQQLQVNLSTSLVISVLLQDNSKFNIKLRDRGEMSFKFNQSIDVVPNSLKAQIQYMYDNKVKADGINNKYSLELLYTTGVSRWVQKILKANTQIQPQKSQDFQVIYGEIQRLSYHKNETKVKSKISNHSDAQIKLNSINHFGIIQRQLNEKNRRNSEEKSEEETTEEEGQKKYKNDKNSGQKLALKKDVISTVIARNGQNEIQQQINLIADSHIFQYTQTTQAKVQLEAKLTLGQKNPQNFIFKPFLNLQSVTRKQSLKLQTIINQFGFHNFEARYICKYWKNLIFGAMIGANWNTNLAQWHKKWEIIVEKQAINRIGNVCASLSNKHYGVRVIHKFNRNNKIQLGVSKKYDSNFKQWPKLGIKLNLNF